MKRETRIAASVFIFGPAAMLTAAIACTYAIANGASMRWRALFRLVCHGIPERCLMLFGMPMPICARCTACYGGLILGLAAYLALPWISERLLRKLAWIGAIPIFVDGVTQALRLRESTNGLRVATGLVAGFAFGMWILSAIEQHVHTAEANS
ncbi:MAG TPA: DUF2085 domain-containing protein [Thermoanaerobaculia bacterium]|nr:DUF2085 domain-containing protein [Thermoanaerobaculia bacterium]